jgi:hypothetical protein
MTDTLALRPDQITHLSKLLIKRRLIHRGDAGTGKTPTICVLQRVRWDRHGHVTVWPQPLKLMEKNREEALLWGGWDADEVVIVNTAAELRAARPRAKVLIMGYERFRLSVPDFWPEIRSIDIDEWHKGFGGHESKRTQALYTFVDRHVRDDGWFVPMTGTHYNGSPGTIYPAIQIIKPTYYGTFENFKNIHYCTDPLSGKVIGYDGLDVLGDILTEISIGESWASVHGPAELVTQVVPVTMSPRQRVMYDKFATDGLLELEQFFVDGTAPGTAYIRSRQIMEHPNAFPNLLGADVRDGSPSHGARSSIDITPGELPGKVELFALDCERHLANGTPFAAFAALVPQQEQLYETARQLGLSVGLLNGNTTRKEAHRIDTEFRAGRLQAIVGSCLVADCGYNWQDWGSREVNECIFVSLPYQDTAIEQGYRRFMRRKRLTALRIKLYAYRDSLDYRIMSLTKRKSVEASQVEPNRQPLPW